MRFLNMLKKPNIINMDYVELRKDRILDLCRQSNLELFFVHGSLAKNQMKPLSDVDIAVLKKNGELSLDEHLRLIGRLQEIFGREDIDLVDLAAAPAPLKMRVIKAGKLFFSENISALISFKYNTFRQFLDTVYLRKSFSAYLRSAVGVK